MTMPFSIVIIKSYSLQLNISYQCHHHYFVDMSQKCFGNHQTTNSSYCWLSLSISLTSFLTKLRPFLTTRLYSDSGWCFQNHLQMRQVITNFKLDSFAIFFLTYPFKMRPIRSRSFQLPSANWASITRSMRLPFDPCLLPLDKLASMFWFLEK